MHNSFVFSFDLDLLRIYLLRLTCHKLFDLKYLPAFALNKPMSLIFFFKKAENEQVPFFFFLYPHDLNIQSQFLSKNDKNWQRK